MVLGNLVVEMLPARHGDAVLLSWGEDGRGHWLLIDGGPSSAYDALKTRLTDVAANGGLELLVLTHVDGDHIEGVLRLCNDASLAVPIRHIWFNGSGQLVDELGTLQGEMLSALVASRGVPLNSHFGGRAAAVRDCAPLPRHELPGGLRLTVLGPDLATLASLRDAWREACEQANLQFGSVEEALELLRGRKHLNPAERFLGAEPEPPEINELATTFVSKDYSLPNRSSIVLLAEYGRARVLLAGDATPGAMLAALRRVLSERGLERLPLSAFKLPHHGSAANVTPEVLALAPAEHYLFSSDGSSPSRHPDAIAVARVLVSASAPTNLVFNYRSPQNSMWDDERLRRQGYQLSTLYPAEGGAGIALSLAAETGKRV
jgi:hypothetical protein